MFNQPKKRTFFEKLTGVTNDEDEDAIAPAVSAPIYNSSYPPLAASRTNMPNVGVAVPEEDTDGQLTADVYQTSSEIIIQTMTAGVRPDDLNISITPEKVSISGKREAPRGVSEEDYFYKELYWGAFSRTIILPQEVVAEEAEAVEKHGLLIIRLPKLDKTKQHRLKVKSL